MAKRCRHKWLTVSIRVKDGHIIAGRYICAKCNTRKTEKVLDGQPSGD